MRNILCLFMLLMTTATAQLIAQPKIDQAAPGFELYDSEGQLRRLNEFSGKYVVLEWVNFDCPFVRKHYSVGAMQSLQKEFTDKGIVWLSICSSAPGKQGHYQGQALLDKLKEWHYQGTAYLIDENGKVGQLYKAKTTPHIFIINPEGKLIYMGAIDDSSDVWGNPREAKNYIREVFYHALMGQTIPTQQTSPYGCSVKY